ncbi:MAG TPA: hypothetical protein VEQ61_00350, partial [Thermoleophilaceae bacterium]|nr:hypothetical protein [Thermoleophilaceae bacterium]
KEIPGYQLEGTLPELNALAAWALFAAHSLALRRGETKVGECWRDAAGELAAALPRLARSGGSLPRLADDQDALTGDLVFPLLAGFGPEPLAAGLARRLARAYQWTEAGARTVGSDQPGYDPEFAGGLMGGISPILTAWVGVAAREHFPGLPVEALRGLASLIENERPNARDLVPGQLPAALHGETFGRLGPSLHPLAAPLMRWLAIEGVLGLRLPLVPWVKSITIQPALPENWSWLVVSRLPWQGGEVSAIVHDGTIHTNGEFEAARIERWARIEPVPGTAVPAWRLQRRGERRLFVAAPDEAYSGTLVAAGSRWRVRLAGGEAALLSEPE